MDYTLRYLPIAKQDLADAINFILNECHIPIAAKILWIKLNRQLCSVLKFDEFSQQAVTKNSFFSK